MTYTDKDRTSALAGVFLCTNMVHILATQGKVDETLFNDSINSLFAFNPNNVSDIYSHRAIIAGAGVLKKFLQKGGYADSKNTFRYALGLMRLEKKLQKNSEMQKLIKQRIEQAHRQKRQLEKFNEPITTSTALVTNLASIYSESISHMTPKIQILGKPQYIQSEYNAKKIRALLLAGIRSAILWQQVGGRSWHFIFSRGRILKTINSQFHMSV